MAKQSTGKMIRQDIAQSHAPSIMGREKMHVNKADLATLMSEGWLVYEAYKLLEGLRVSIDTPAVQAMRKSRIIWTTDMMIRGMTGNQIKNAINDFYLHNSDVSPFEFLRREYQPPKRIDGLTMYQSAMQRRKEAKFATRNLYKPKHTPYRKAYTGW